MTSPPVALLGAQTPQTLRAPEFETTAGDEAVELAASCGLVCDPWQGKILHTAMGERRDGSGGYVWASRMVVVIVSRQNGKGSLLEARALAAALLEPGQTVAWTAHEMRTAKEAFRRFVKLVRESDELTRQVKVIREANGQEAVEFHNGSRVLFSTRTKGALRGFTINLLILDEAYALTEEQMGAIMFTIAAVENPQVWFTSSPPIDSETGEALYLLRDAALRGSSGIAYFDWGVPGVDLSDLSGVDLDDPEVWAATNPAYGYRITAEGTAAERASMTPEAFARERCGIWPPRHGGGSVIDPEAWRLLGDEESTVGANLAFAVDVTPSRDFASIALYGLRADGLGHLELIDRRPGTEWLVERVLELKRRWKPVAIGLDVRGPAGSLLLDFEKAGLTRPVDPEKPRIGDLAVPTTQEAAAACGQLVDATRQATLRHTGQEQLSVAVAGAKTRPLGDAWGWARRAASVDISPLVAATLARWAFETRAHLVNRKANMVNIW